MRVLVSDALGKAGIELLEKEDGIKVDVKLGLSSDELKKIIDLYDALIVRSGTKVTEDLLKLATKLKIIGRAGIGVDNIDVSSAKQLGKVVVNTPTGNVITTAEHAIAMMLSLTRNIPMGTTTLKNGLWEKKKLQGREIFNKTLGIVGFGKIGAIVADRAFGLKMKVSVYDPFVSSNQIEELGFNKVDLDELYAISDYISIHVPKMQDTINMLNKEAFGKMKDGVMIVNCARGGIVNELDLYDAMVSGKVFGAAFDVFNEEPPKISNKLFKLDRFVCTPHLGASTVEAQRNVAVMVSEQIIDYLKNGKVINSIN